MKISTNLCALALLAGSALASASSATAPAAMPAYITAAVTDSTRPEADRTRDADRKPAETLLFADIRPGKLVVELVPGGGYYTRLLSHVVGKHGKVFAVSPAPRTAPEPGEPDRAAPVKAIAADPHYGNVTVLIQPISSLSLPEQADVVWTSQNYHDVHNVTGLDLLAFNKSIFTALKPGGEYFVIDHSAAADAPPDVTSTLHRIDSELVKREVIAAGFVLEEESPLLRNSADSRTMAIFDPAIRGKTDQFVLKFRKPKH